MPAGSHGSNYSGIHHVGVLCKDIDSSVKFYKDVLGKLLAGQPEGVPHLLLCGEGFETQGGRVLAFAGMEINPDRPDEKLPYKGAWLWVGGEMIHLMELPNPDPEDGRPEHGGRDRHVCLVRKLSAYRVSLKQNKGSMRTRKQ